MTNNLCEILSNNCIRNISRIYGICFAYDRGCIYKADEQSLILCHGCNNFVCNSCIYKNLDKCIFCVKNKISSCECDNKYGCWIMCWECGNALFDYCLMCKKSGHGHLKYYGLRGNGNYCNHECYDKFEKKLISK